jgi:hypothetical protein
MRDLLKLDISKGGSGYLELKPLPINGIQAEIRLSSTPEQLQTLKLLVPEIESILFKFDKLYRDFLSGKVTNYLMVQEVLERFDTPNIQGAQINEDFLLDLTEELHDRLGRIEALIPDKVISTPKNISTEFRDVYDGEVTEERKAALKAELNKIEGVPEKIKYLEIKKLEYLQNIPSRSFEVSGRVIGSGFQGGPLLFDRFIELEIEKLKIELNTTNTNSNFQSIFNPNNNAYNVCIDLLEDLQITFNGECKLTKGRIGLLTGAISAMKEKNSSFFKQDFTEIELLNYFNTFLNTNYKTFSKRNEDFGPAKGSSKTFIDTYLKK